MVKIDIDMPKSCIDCTIRKIMGCRIANESGWLSNRRDERCLLKSDEPRMMTLEEIKRHDNQDGCVWFEQPTYNAVAAFVRQDEECTEIISPYLLGEPINHGYMSNTFYGKTWRFWTSRPSEQQMRDTKWEEHNG